MLATLYSQREFDLLDIGAPAHFVFGLVLIFFYGWLGSRKPRVAFCSLPIVTALYFLSGALIAAVDEAGPLLVISIFMSVLFFISGLYGIARCPVGVDQDKAPWPKTWAQWILKFLGVLSLLAALLFVVLWVAAVFIVLLPSCAVMEAVGLVMPPILGHTVNLLGLTVKAFMLFACLVMGSASIMP